MRNSETDRISYKTFISNEEREMQSNDPAKQNIGKCIKQADTIFYNNSTVEKLYKDVEAVLKDLNL
jgi:dephospho-CoA kinase